MNVHEAKTHLSRLLAEVQAGREIVISKAGRPIAKLVPYDGPPVKHRSPGGWQGRVEMAVDFDVLPDHVLASFEGGPE